MITDQEIQRIKKNLLMHELVLFELFLSDYHAKYSKVEEMQKAFEGIHRIASETFESHNQLELIRLKAVEHLKGGETNDL